MRKLIICLFIPGLLWSCSKGESAGEAPPPQEATPEALEEEEFSDFISYKRGRYSDIVQQLYAEALESNPELEALEERIGQLQETHADSLKAYRKYVENNAAYWRSIDGYIANLSDSSLQEELKVLFAGLENEYKEKLAPLEGKAEAIARKEQSLQDRHTLMKLLVTLPMMQRYQQNKLPESKPLDQLIRQYDEVIEDTTPYTQIEE